MKIQAIQSSSIAPAARTPPAPGKVKDADGDTDGDKPVAGPGGATTVKLSSAATQALATPKDQDGDAA